MGRLLDTVKAKLAAIRQELALPMPDAGIDPNAAVDAAQKMKEAMTATGSLDAIRTSRMPWALFRPVTTPGKGRTIAGISWVPMATG